MQTRTHTRTFAVLELPTTVVETINSMLKDAGYSHAFIEDGLTDMSGIAIKDSGESRLCKKVAGDVLKFLSLCGDGGRIVSSNDLNKWQIAEAQQEKRWFVDDNGFGYAVLPWELTTGKDRERELGFQANNPAAEGMLSFSYEEIEAACGGATAQLVKASIMDRRAKIASAADAQKAEIVEGEFGPFIHHKRNSIQVVATPVDRTATIQGYNPNDKDWPRKDGPSIPTAAENKHGLHQRYIITKANGEPVDVNALYFVLRLDDDGDDELHVNACRKAATVYAKMVRQTHLHTVGVELERLINDITGEWQEDERTQHEKTIDALIDILDKSQLIEILNSALEILGNFIEAARRNGENTNWDGLRSMAMPVFNKMHRILNGFE